MENDAPTTLSPAAAARRGAVANGLLPIVRIADQPLHWTIQERLAHYGCPAVGIATMQGGHIDWADGFGHLAAGGNEPCGPDTIFMVASCS